MPEDKKQHPKTAQTIYRRENMRGEIIITEEQLEPLRKLGLIREAVLRNIQIKRDYRRMKKKGTHRKKELLADKYNLQPETICCILFDSRYHQNPEKPYIRELR